MKLVRCKCGHEHECPARLSNVERAQKAAAARMGKVQTVFATSPLQTQTVEIATPKPREPMTNNGLCEHHRDPKFCRIGMCADHARVK